MAKARRALGKKTINYRPIAPLWGFGQGGQGRNLVTVKKTLHKKSKKCHL